MKNSPAPKIAALLEQIESGQLKSDKARILNFVKTFKGQNKLTIGNHFGIPHQTVTARLSDLEDLGLIESKGAGKYSNFYYLQDPQAQKLHRAKRQADKLEAWAKRGIQLGISKDVIESLQHD